jgi:RPA family protein
MWRKRASAEDESSKIYRVESSGFRKTRGKLVGTVTCMHTMAVDEERRNSRISFPCSEFTTTSAVTTFLEELYNSITYVNLM